ncbi:hypothetical protein FRC19_010208 [Serendipita sp. 401]|nr:hypothetical protein FRC19_010208 [Serendipita sp. 401]
MLTRSSARTWWNQAVEERFTDPFRCSLGHQQVRGGTKPWKKNLLIISDAHLVIRKRYETFPKNQSQSLVDSSPVAKARRVHNEALRSKTGYYIQNHLPIRLLQLSNMVLVDRTMLQKRIDKKITQDSFLCKGLTCHCLEKVKDELKYAILSHRWGSAELTFNDLGKLHEEVTRNNPPSFDVIVSTMQRLVASTPFKPSFTKLVKFREVAAKRQCKYGWVDTICINKESSAELDESIRSMYAWYRDSDVCIVHLSQTHHSRGLKDDPWFTRGWTLQELLAPKQIKFFSSSWRAITSRKNDKGLNSAEQQAAKEGKDKPPLWSTINKITWIPIEDLLDFKPGLYDIGKRMSWVSQRQTTRVEDMAYCLIGIFRVNLSIAYGEKEGAFYRLQAEIMQNCNDKSLLGWKGEASPYNSLFAASPQCFSQALVFPTNNKPSVDATQNSTSKANFERRISHILYYKSEVPDLRIWEDSRVTAFTILGPSFRPREYAVMLLELVGADQHYERLGAIKIKIKGELPGKSPSEILIK